MKKSIFLFFITLFFTVSCSNSHNSKLSYTDENTIKHIIKEKELNALWTDELEKNRLSNKNVFSDKIISKSVNLELDVLKVIDYQARIYPEFADFGSLDNSKLSSEIVLKINSLCESISKDINNIDAIFFNSKYYFSYFLFKNDLLNGWEQNFNEKFPVSETENVEIFNKWYIGEPFISNSVVQVPVRFFTDKGFVDINIFMSEIDDFKIYQINLLKWGK